MRFNTLSDSEIVGELCQRIRETRIQLGLSQSDLAERARVGIATVKRVEAGEAVTLTTLIGILRGLESLHQLESLLFDSHLRTFNQQINSDSARSRIRKKQPPLKNSAAADSEAAKPVKQGVNEWYVSSATSNVYWSFGNGEPEK